MVFVRWHYRDGVYVRPHYRRTRRRAMIGQGTLLAPRGDARIASNAGAASIEPPPDRALRRL